MHSNNNNNEKKMSTQHVLIFGPPGMGKSDMLVRHRDRRVEDGHYMTTRASITDDQHNDTVFISDEAPSQFLCDPNRGPTEVHIQVHIQAMIMKAALSSGITSYAEPPPSSTCVRNVSKL